MVLLLGYPYKTEEQMQAVLEKLLKGDVPLPFGKGDQIGENDTIILVTHVGPHNSSMV